MIKPDGGVGSQEIKPIRVALVCLGVSTAVVTVLVTALTPRFMTNDDVVMALIASGKLLAPTPNEHLLHTNVALGLPLRWLYEQAPTVPWYSINLYACLVLASTLTLASCLLWQPSTLLRWLVWGLVLSVLARFALVMQFTVVATWLSWASVAWSLSVAHASARTKTVRWSALVGVGGVVLAGFIREEAAVLGVIMAAPLIVWFFLCVDRRRPLLPFASAAAGILLVVGASAADEAYYAASPGWEEFHRLKRATSYFVDYGLIRPGPRTSRALQRADWGDADLGMILSWFFWDEQIFSLRRIETVVDEAAQWNVAPRLLGGLSAQGTVRRDELAGAALALLVLLVFVASRRVWLGMGAVGAWYLVLAVSISVLTRPPPDRVYLPCLAAVICSGLLMSCVRRTNLGDSRVLVVAVLLLIGPGLVGVRSAISGSNQHARRVEQFRMDWNAFYSSSTKLVVDWGGALPYELIVSPFRENISSMASVPLLSLGTVTRTPITRSRSNEAGIEDLHTALLDAPGVEFIAREDWLPFFIGFLRDRYGRDVVAESTFDSTTFTAWHLVERPVEQTIRVPAAAATPAGRGAARVSR